MKNKEELENKIILEIETYLQTFDGIDPEDLFAIKVDIVDIVRDNFEVFE
jgi:hypothetical protein